MRLLNTDRLVYTTSRKLVILSIILTAASLIFAIIFFLEPPILFGIYIAAFLAMCVVTIIIKLSIYSRKEHGVQNDPSEHGSPLWPLIIALIVAMFLPFILMVLLDPSTVIILLDAYIAGVNLPEVILYSYARRKGKVLN